MDVSYILMERSIPTSLKYWIKDNQTQNNYKDGQYGPHQKPGVNTGARER